MQGIVSEFSTQDWTPEHISGVRSSPAVKDLAFPYLQIIGLVCTLPMTTQNEIRSRQSATLANISDVCHSLGAVLYTTNFRPVPLQQFAKIGRTVYGPALDKPVRSLPPLTIKDVVCSLRPSFES